MKRQVEEPKVEKREGPGRTNEQRVTHPAFGQIRASRVSGHANLYGSDFSHQHYVQIVISESELVRSLSTDWPHEKRELISVNLSEAQWARMVSSLSAGAGVQCTISHVGGDRRPALPDPGDRREQFKDEAKKTMEEARKALAELVKEISSTNALSQKRKVELCAKVMEANRAIGSSAGFVMDQFDEHMEETVQKAKVEVDAYLHQRVTQMGLANLDGEGPLLIGETIDKTYDDWTSGDEVGRF